MSIPYKFKLLSKKFNLSILSKDIPPLKKKGILISISFNIFQSNFFPEPP